MNRFLNTVSVCVYFVWTLKLRLLLVFLRPCLLQRRPASFLKVECCCIFSSLEYTIFNGSMVIAVKKVLSQSFVQRFRLICYHCGYLMRYMLFAVWFLLLSIVFAFAFLWIWDDFHTFLFVVMLFQISFFFSSTCFSWISSCCIIGRFSCLLLLFVLPKAFLMFVLLLLVNGISFTASKHHFSMFLMTFPHVIIYVKFLK